MLILSTGTYFRNIVLVCKKKNNNQQFFSRGQFLFERSLPGKRIHLLNYEESQNQYDSNS